MPSTRQFCLTVLLAVAVVALINPAASLRAPHAIPRRVMEHARETTTDQVVALGNSLIVAGLDEGVFDGSVGLPENRGVSNLGLGNSSPVEQLLLLRYAQRLGMRPRMLIYGIYDFQLTDSIRLRTEDLIGNRTMLYELEPQYGRTFLNLSLHDTAEFQVMRLFPMFVYRGAVWSRVERLRRFLGQQGLPPQSSNEFGRTADFALLEASSSRAFEEQCVVSSSAPLTSAAEELLRQARAAGAAPVVVVMPMSPHHLQAYYSAPSWPGYLEHLHSLLAPYGVELIDASKWEPDASYFVDTVHLADSGRERFSRELASRLRPKIQAWAGTPQEAKP